MSILGKLKLPQVVKGLNQRIKMTAADLDVTAIFYISLGLGIGLVVALSGVAVSIFADTNASVTLDTDTNFSQGSLTNTQVNGSGAGAYVNITNLNPAGWLGSGWQFRKKININNASYAENLVNFPLLLQFSAANFDFTDAQTDADDLRFTDTDGTTLLDFEIQSWDSGAQTGLVWVRVPQIDASTNDDYIYVYYGNAGSTAAENPAGVWGDYRLALHLDESPAAASPQFTDLTGNGNNGVSGSTLNGANAVTGKIGNGVSFDNSPSDTITVNNSTSLFVNTSVTVSYWMRLETTETQGVVFIRSSGTNTNYGMGLDVNGSTEGLSFGYNPGNPSDETYFATGIFPNDNTWRHVVMTYSYGTGSSVKIYVNGVAASGSWVSGNGNATYSVDASAPIVIGSGLGLNLWGAVDEFKLIDEYKSAVWVAAEYTNTSGTSYTTFGTEEGIADASGQWESPADGNAIDLIWSGGWGDGTAGSTAFSATVANVSANATIAFQMRVATTVGGLSSASYNTIGTANTGTTLTVSAGTLDSLGLATGANRYVQVRATLVSADNSANPRLDSFTIYYRADDTAPETAPGAIDMFKNFGGAELNSNDWTNNSAPYFSWTAAADSQAGLKGYCVYLGTDSGGNPALDKGLLGTSPVFTAGTTCQFITSATSLDFANTSLRGGTWLTSNSSPYYFAIKPVDQAGNVAASSTVFQFRFDSTVPTNPAFISLPSEFVATKDVTFTWPTGGGSAAADANSGVAGLQYRIGASGTWFGDVHNSQEDATDLLVNDGAYTTSPTYDYPVIVEGNNIIYIRTWDVAGNVTTIYLSGALKVNTVAPSEPANLIATPTDNITNSYSFDWDPPTNFSGQAGNITYCYSVNTIPSPSSCSFTAAGVTSLPADAYATQPGANVMYVVARDEASNINYSVYAQASFTYSGSAPGIPRNLEVSDISIKDTANWRLVLSWDLPADVGAGVQNYRIYRSATSTSCTSDFAGFSQIATTAGTSFTDSGLTQQTYYYCLRACDSANSCSALSSTANGFPDGRFDTPAELVTAPTVTNITTTRATVTWTTVRGADSRVSYGTTSANYFPEEPSRPEQTTSHSITLINLTPGTTYFFRARWVDEDGNVGVSDERLFVTLPAPTVSEVGVDSIGVNRATLRYTTANAAAVRVYYGPTAGFGSLIQNSTNLAVSSYLNNIVDLQDGTKYFFRINPVDVEGNEYTGTTLDFTTLPRPKISGLEVTEVRGESQPTIDVKWSTNIETVSQISYYPETNPSLVKEVAAAEYLTGEQTSRVRGLDPNTRYVVALKVRDRFGNEAESVPYSYVTGDDTRPPKISNLRIESAVVNPGIGGEELPTAQLIVSWDTDEPATSQVEFGEGSSGTLTQRSFKENKLTYNHIVVLTKLEPSKVYSLQVLSSDGAGNEAISGGSVTITPKAGETAIEIVLKSLSEIFGFF